VVITKIVSNFKLIKINKIQKIIIQMIQFLINAYTAELTQSYIDALAPFYEDIDSLFSSVLSQ